MAKIEVKRGRKPIKASERKSKNFTVRFKDDEFRLLKKDAKIAGCPPAEFLRKCWLESRGK